LILPQALTRIPGGEPAHDDRGGHRVVTGARNPRDGGVSRHDMERETLAALAPDLAPWDFVFVLAAISSPAACHADPDRTWRFNVKITAARLAEIARTGARAAFVSTDRVFDGVASRRSRRAGLLCRRGRDPGLFGFFAGGGSSMNEDAANSPGWPTLQRAVEAAAEADSPSAWNWISRRLPALSKPRFDPGIYILAYHQIYDPATASPWERAYAKAATSAENFRAHIAVLRRHMTPLDLVDVPARLAAGAPDTAYFVVTFDDGYANLLSNAAGPIADAGIPATVFVNAAALESWVYYRVLASVLVAEGHAQALAAHLGAVQPGRTWEGDAKRVFDLTKNQYEPRLTERAVEAAFHECVGDPKSLGVHLDTAGLRKLVDAGWRLGNHGWDHVILNDLDLPDIAETYARNEQGLAARGLPSNGWFAYPNGRAQHVNSAVRAWLAENPRINACFCGGGVNLVPTRTQWLRIGVGDWTCEELESALRREARLTRNAISRLREPAHFE
jgi:peptidoglycan/xylan/chitin deacetylase (PgdA/CDA1 family)